MVKYFAILLLCCCSLAWADDFLPHASYQVCFTPGGKCTSEIVAAIDNAQQQILVQAFNFTSRPIAHALVRAQQRGAQVKILFDKSLMDNTWLLYYVKNKHLWFKIDAQPTIAHNKVMIIDEHVVVTGSFNFTRAAQKDNAENVLIIDDSALAQKYAKNWYSREKQSVTASHLNSVQNITSGHQE